METEDFIEDSVAEHPGMAGSSVLAGSVPDGTDAVIHMFTPDTPRVALLRDFGLVDSPDVGAVMSNVEGEAVFGKISLENINALDTDLFVGWAGPAAKDGTALDNTMFTMWGPIQEGHFFVNGDDAMEAAFTSPSVLGIRWMVDNGFLDDIATALDGGRVLRS